MKITTVKKWLAALLAAFVLAAAVPAGALAHAGGTPLFQWKRAEDPHGGAEQVLLTGPRPEDTAEHQPGPAQQSEPRSGSGTGETSGRGTTDFRVWGDYIMRGVNTVMLSTLMAYFHIPGQASNVSSSNAGRISLTESGNDWRITVLQDYDGLEYVYFTAGGSDYGFDFECGKAYDYIDRQWEDGQIVETVLTAWNPADILEAGTNLTEGWYVSAESSATVGSRIDINGEVHIILTDGSKLYANGGVRINEGAALKIYGGPDDSGLLEAHPGSGPGIGNGSKAGYSLLICGGTIDAKGGADCAGIGGGSGASGISYLTINGGNITAQGGSDGSGIGKGSRNTWPGEIAINGGTVEAEGGVNGAGIGGGKRCGTGPVTINGGTVTARAGELGAGIGGGANSGQGSPVTINGGENTITAPSASGAGIGGGAGYMEYLVEYSGGNGGSVNINGGKTTIRLYATRSAGIGGGGYDCNSGTLNGDVIITGGELHIEINNGYVGDDHVTSQGAGIGGGSERTPSGQVIIDGGEVTVENYGYGAGIGGGASEKKPSTAGSGGRVTIGGESLVVCLSNGGAGIGGGGSITGGGGGGNGGTLTINGGEVVAISGDKGAGVGGGNDGNGGTLIMNDGYLMAAGGCLDFNYVKDHGLYSGSIPGVSAVNQGWANLFSNLLMHFFVSGSYGGAGIGGGDDGKGGTVIINGGEVVAKGGRNSARAIGHGDGGSGDGSLTLCDDVSVSYARLASEGDGRPDTETLSDAANREKDCKNHAFVHIIHCAHEEALFVNRGDGGHQILCGHCKVRDMGVLPHDFTENDHSCSICGHERVMVTLLPGDGTGSADPVWAAKNSYYTLPGPPAEFTGPNDRAFFGWLVSSLNQNYAPGSEIKLTGDVTLTAQWTDPYNLWVAGVRVTNANKDDVLGDGKVSYDPETSTLDLNGVDGFSGVNDNKIFIYSNRINLRMTGSGSLYAQSGVVCRDVINVNMGSLTIDGDFTITNSMTMGALKGTGLNVARDVVFEGGSITITAAGNAVSVDNANRNIIIKNGVERLDVTSTAESGVYYALKVYDPGCIILEDRMFVTEYERLDGSTGDVDLSAAKHVVIERGAVVTFDPNGGTIGGSGNSVSFLVPMNGTVTLPEEPERGGFGFGGWYADAALTVPFDPAAPISGDITVLAMWTVEYGVTVSFSDPNNAPSSVSAVLQHAERFPGPDGSVTEEWTTLETVVIRREGGEWTGTFTPIPYEGENAEDSYRIRELDMFGELVPGDGGLPMALFEVVVTSSYLPGADPGRAITTKRVAYFAEYTSSSPRHVEIINTDSAAYTVEGVWDIDLAGGDRPDEIQAVLQRRTGWTSWESLEVQTLNAANGWSCAFAPVPVGNVTEDGAEAVGYRIRQLAARSGDAPEPSTAQEILADADARIVYDKWDFDKPFIRDLLGQVGSELSSWSYEDIMDYLAETADPALVGEPVVSFRVEGYTDIIGKQIGEHDTDYFVRYEQNDGGHSMRITDIAVLDIAVSKRWVGFEAEEMPSSVRLAVLGRASAEYAEAVGADAANEYRPLLSAVYGDMLDMSGMSGMTALVREGVRHVVGGSASADTINSVVTSEMSAYLTAGLAAAEATGGSGEAANGWRIRLGVKKYGGYGVPMEFAGAELTAGLIELAANAYADSLGAPRVDMPSVYEPSGGYWSIKGCAVHPDPDEDGPDLVCSVINIKHRGEEGPGTAVGGAVLWENDSEAYRPESVAIHVRVTDGNGELTEVPGSPVTVLQSDGWVWFIEIPPELAYGPAGEGGEEGVRPRSIVIEEEVPPGYEAQYECGVIINRWGRLPGDVDLSGGVNAVDALLAMRYAMSLIALGDQALVNGDMDGDGIVSAADAILIMRIVLEQ